MPQTSSGTIELATPEPVALGDQITFIVTIDGNVKTPRVEILAYQDETLVYAEAGSAFDTFMLGGNPQGGSNWADAGGPATCVANLFFFKKQEYVLLASTQFNAEG